MKSITSIVKYLQLIVTYSVEKYHIFSNGMG